LPVPKENLLGAEEGLNKRESVGWWKVSIAALSLGITRCMLAAVAYSKEQQFGKAISEFRGIAFKCSEYSENRNDFTNC
jgi:alkylation response protein AidB-like acyl-CoA dehydrogenase